MTAARQLHRRSDEEDGVRSPWQRRAAVHQDRDRRAEDAARVDARHAGRLVRGRNALRLLEGRSGLPRRSDRFGGAFAHRAAGAGEGNAGAAGRYDGRRPRQGAHRTIHRRPVQPARRRAARLQRRRAVGDRSGDEREGAGDRHRRFEPRTRRASRSRRGATTARSSTSRARRGRSGSGGSSATTARRRRTTR